MTIILYGNLADNSQRNEIEAITRDLRRAWLANGFIVVSEVDDKAKGERKFRIDKKPNP